MNRTLRRLLSLLALLAIVLVLAVACGGDDDDGGTSAPSASATQPGATEAPGPGDAGISSNPREVAGLEGIVELDDGLAIWSERPAAENRTGITDDTIKIGRTTGITGAFAAYEPYWGGVLNTMIERINDAGGIHGRKIELVTKDDASDPTTGVQVTSELIDADQVFALFFSIGAFTHAAVHDYHVEKEVPDLFYFDASTLGQEPETSPWDFNGQNSDIMGGFAMAEAVLNIDPEANPALVYADFPASQDGRKGILTALDGVDKGLAADLSHDLTQVDLSAQATQVADSGANWLIYHGSIGQSVSLVKSLRETAGSDMPVMQWGWVPTADPATDAIFDGTYQVTFVKSPYVDATNAAWPKLQALAGNQYAPLLAAQSLMAIEHLVRALELAGPDLTREGLVEALELGFDGSWSCSVCLAPTVFGPQDHWQNESYLVGKWDQAAQKFEIIDTLNYETSEGKGVRGNIPGFECQTGTCPWKE